MGGSAPQPVFVDLSGRRVVGTRVGLGALAALGAGFLALLAVGLVGAGPLSGRAELARPPAAGAPQRDLAVAATADPRSEAATTLPGEGTTSPPSTGARQTAPLAAPAAATLPPTTTPARPSATPSSSPAAPQPSTTPPALVRASPAATAVAHVTPPGLGGTPPGRTARPSGRPAP